LVQFPFSFRLLVDPATLSLLQISFIVGGFGGIGGIAAVA